MCGWSFWIDSLDPNLPDGPFVCERCDSPRPCLFCGCEERLKSGRCPECGAPDQAEAQEASKHWDWAASKKAGKPVRKAPAWLVEAMGDLVKRGPEPDPGGE